VSERFLVTGALGCIGAWVCRLLVEEGVPVSAYDLGDDRRRLRLIMDDGQLERIDFVRGDITDYDALANTLAERAITHIIHLAALQVPFVRSDPVAGARVNVSGTVNILEAAHQRQLGSTIAYASSAAVYDATGAIDPATLYGVFKLANEGAARVYAAESGVASVGLRPFTVYGPGRDQGITSGPTAAMLAAARGEPYRISFGGRTQFHYAPDVARAFIHAARSASTGAAVYNLGGAARPLQELVDAIRDVAPGAAVDVDESTRLPFPDELPPPWYELRLTPLEQGVRETIELFRAALAAESRSVDP